MTARDVIEGAMRLLGILQANESAEASEAADGLQALNDMLHEWPFDLQHEDLSLTDDLRTPPNHYRGIRYNLAVELAPEFGRQIPPAVAKVADETYRQLCNEYANPARLDAHQFDSRFYDIDRDT